MSPPEAAARGYEFKAFRYSSHFQILRLLEREKSPLRILDVGAASGYLGKLLKERGHYVSGIEYDPVAAEAARKYYDAFQVADIETYEFPSSGEFDYILFADVLEHLRNPSSVLRKGMSALKPSGKVVISLPNVANITIRLSLLAGRFDYMDRGILDRTHLRFFTLRTMKQMLKDVSCEILDVAVAPLPFQLVFPSTSSAIFRPFHEALYLATRAWKAVFAYQFIVLAVPRRVPSE